MAQAKFRYAGDGSMYSHLTSGLANLLDSALSLNATGYLYDYIDLQV